MPLRSRSLPNYTYADYLLWEGKWEIIDGIPFAMSPAPTIRHQRLAARIRRELGNQLADQDCTCEALDPIDLKISEHTVLQPDVVIVCNAQDAAFLDTSPELVVEVLSPSTRLKDLYSKYDLYQDFGIKYYVIVDPENNTIKVFLLDDHGIYQEVNGYTFNLEDNCNITADLDSIWG